MKRFITVLMSAMIALSMMPSMAFAQSTAVAKINDVSYGSLEEAFANANANDEINLIENCAVSDVILVDKAVTLNLNGKTVTNGVTGGRMFRVYDTTFIINGSGGNMVIPESNNNSFGFVDMRSTSGATTGNEKLVVKNTSFSGATTGGNFFAARAWYQEFELINVNATCTLGDGSKHGSYANGENYSIINNNNNCMLSVAITGGVYQYDSRRKTIGVFQLGRTNNLSDKADDADFKFEKVKVVANDGPIIEVQNSTASFKDCSFTQNYSDSYYGTCVAASRDGRVFIDGGEYTDEGDYPLYVYSSGGKINVLGGAFVGKKAALKADRNKSDYAGDNNSEIVVSDGTFIGDIQLMNADCILSVTGGNFSVDPSSYVAKGYFATRSGDVWTVAPPVAKIGGIEYGTLKEAVESVTDDTKTTIKLLRDVEDGDGIIVNPGKNIEFDFGGHAYTVTKNLAGSNNTKTQCFQLLKGSTVTMKNGCIKANNSSIKMMVQNYSNLTIQDMDINATADGTSNSVGYGLSNNCGDVKILGSSRVSVAGGATAVEACYWPSSYPEGTSVVVDTSGDIKGNIEVGLYGNNGSISTPTKSLLNVANANHVGSFVFINSKDGPYGTGLTDEEALAELGDKLIVSGGKFSSNPKVYAGNNEIYHQNNGSYFVGSKPSNTSGHNDWELKDGVFEEIYVAPTPTPEPEDPITNTGSGDNASTNVDTSDKTTTSESGKTETVVDADFGDKIVQSAEENKSTEVVINAETEKGASKETTVALPETTVKNLAEKTEATVTIKTDNAAVTLDKAAVDAVAAQAGTTGEVKLIVETKESSENKVEVNLKIETSNGTVSDFKGGNVTVTVAVDEKLAEKTLVCVYIDDNGVYTKVGGELSADKKTFVFTTGHFSTYAILSEEEADAIIAEQNKASDIASAKVTGVVNKTYTGKSITQNPVVTVGESKLVKGTDYTVSYKNNVNAGVATLTIKGAGSYTGTITKTFKINPKGTSISKVTGQKKAVKVVWKKQLTKMKSSYVSGYQVQYSTSSKFTSGTSKYTNAKFSKGRTTKTIKNLKAGKKYYVRVRTYKTVDGTKCYSSWSKAKSVKTK